MIPDRSQADPRRKSLAQSSCSNSGWGKLFLQVSRFMSPELGDEAVRDAESYRTLKDADDAGSRQSRKSWIQELRRREYTQQTHEAETHKP